MNSFWAHKRIIVGGLPRSGSTLVRFMLDRSETVLSGPETNFLQQPLWQVQERESRIAPKLAEKLDVPIAGVQTAIADSHSTIEAFDRVMQQYAKKVVSPKRTWAEKSPPNCFAYGRIATEDPDAYFVSTIRHGLDVCTSIIDDHPRRKGYWFSIQGYVDTMRAIYGFQHPRHFILRYEDLVKSPLEITRKLFEFLDEPHSDDVVQDFNRPSATRDLSKVHQPKLMQQVSTEWIDRWRKPEHQQRVAEFNERVEAIQWLQTSGYHWEPNGANAA
jgi:hypothetical protein